MTMNTQDDANSQPGEARSSDQLGPLVACPMCGGTDGYTLRDGATYRWWDVTCKGCGRMVDECHSDRRTTFGRSLPERWPDADRAWNDAGNHADGLFRSMNQAADLIAVALQHCSQPGVLALREAHNLLVGTHAKQGPNV
jgi:hypothetical protein